MIACKPSFIQKNELNDITQGRSKQFRSNDATMIKGADTGILRRRIEASDTGVDRATGNAGDKAQASNDIFSPAPPTQLPTVIIGCISRDRVCFMLSLFKAALTHHLEFYLESHLIVSTDTPTNSAAYGEYLMMLRIRRPHMV